MIGIFSNVYEEDNSSLFGAFEEPELLNFDMHKHWLNKANQLDQNYEDQREYFDLANEVINQDSPQNLFDDFLINEGEKYTCIKLDEPQQDNIVNKESLWSAEAVICSHEIIAVAKSDSKDNSTIENTLPTSEDLITRDGKIQIIESAFFPKLPQLDTANITNSVSKRISGYSRWGMKEDILLSEGLRRQGAENDIPLDIFWSNKNMSYEKCDIIESLANELNWRNTHEELYTRIYNMGNNQSLSIRQIKLIKKLCKLQLKSSRKVNYEKLVGNFPFKLVSTLKAAYEKLTFKNL